MAILSAGTALGCGGSSDGEGGGGAGGEDAVAGGAGGSAAPTYSVSLRGLAQKGPFAEGSVVEATTLDGSPLSGDGDGFVTVDDATGFFELGAVEHGGPLLLTAEGSYFHEVLGTESFTAVRLRAMVDVRDDGPIAANVNVVSHLVQARAQALLDGLEPSDAVGQARGEVVEALGVGVTDLELDLVDTSLDVMTGGSTEDAYGLALSAVVLQASELLATNLTPGTAIVPELLDELAADFADGALSSDHRELLRAAETEVLTTRTEDLVRELGMGEVPDLDAVVDTDHDDVVNVEDSCPWVDNPSQEPVLASVCHAFARPLPAAEALDGVRSMVLGPIDGDAFIDAVVVGEDDTLTLMAGGPDGTLTTTHQETLPAVSVQLADVAGDARPELLVTGIDVLDVRMLEDGTSSFGQSVISNVPTQGGGGFAIGDMNGDQLPDLLALASFGVVGSFELPVRLLVNQGGGAFVDAQVEDGIAGLDSLAGPLATSLTDVDGDGFRDAVVVAVDPAADEVVVLVYPGDGAAGLGAPTVSRHALPPSADPAYIGDAALVDVTSDGRLDVTLVGRLDVVVVLPGLSDASFASPVTSDVGIDLTHARVLAVGDFTGDDEPDLAAAVDPDFVEGIHMIVIPGRGDGTYAEANTRVARLLGPVSDALHAAAADLDDNGADDLLIGLESGGPVSVGVMRFTP